MAGVKGTATGACKILGGERVNINKITRRLNIFINLCVSVFIQRPSTAIDDGIKNNYSYSLYHSQLKKTEVHNFIKMIIHSHYFIYIETVCQKECMRGLRC